MLALRNVTKRYGTITALDDVSLDIAPGEFFGLLGPNGAGKSTLMSLVAGLRAPDAGTLALDGRPLTAGPRRPARRLGLVPQTNALFTELTAEENLRIFGELQGLRGAELKGRARRRFRRRPARGPPPLARENLLRRHATPAQPRRRAPAPPEASALRRAHRRRRSAVAQRDLRIPAAAQPRRASPIIYSTHYMEEAERLCSRIGIIDHGKILALGTLDELLTRLPFEDEITLPRRPPPLRRWSPRLAAARRDRRRRRHAPVPPARRLSARPPSSPSPSRSTCPRGSSSASARRSRRSSSTSPAAIA